MVNRLRRCAQERIRPEYAALASELEVNPVTGLEEPHFPDAVRHCRFVLTVTTVLMLVRHVPTCRRCQTVTHTTLTSLEARVTSDRRKHTEK